MGSDRRSGWTAAGAVVAFVAVASLGNLRLAASELRQAPSAPASRSDVPPSAALGERVVADDAATGASVDQAAAVGGEEHAELVPAIYAWDPDVRFIYHRHVSKWM